MKVVELGPAVVRKSWQVIDFIIYFNIVHTVRHVLHCPFTDQLSCITLCFFAQLSVIATTPFDVYGHHLQGDN